jgi:hypothetical protein
MGISSERIREVTGINRNTPATTPESLKAKAMTNERKTALSQLEAFSFGII